MSNSITLTGSLSMMSTNGDGPQVLLTQQRLNDYRQWKAKERAQ